MNNRGFFIELSVLSIDFFHSFKIVASIWCRLVSINSKYRLMGIRLYISILKLESLNQTEPIKFAFVGKFVLVCVETFRYESSKIINKPFSHDSITCFVCRWKIRED